MSADEYLARPSLEAVGRVVVNAAGVELTLAGILGDLVRSDRAELLISGQPFSWLEQAIRAVIKHHWESGAGDQLIELLGRAKELQQQRDLVVHGFWLPADFDSYLDGEDPSEYFTVRSRRFRDGHSGKVITDGKLVELARALGDLDVTLREWRNKYLPLLEESSSIRRVKRPRPGTHFVSPAEE